jgi:hypothetical protein
VAPERDLPLLHSIVRSVTDDRRYMLVPELEVCRNIEKAVDVQTNKVLGWRARKIYASIYASDGILNLCVRKM